jgi:D-alanyl-D-alanine carboxypeptidase
MNKYLLILLVSMLVLASCEKGEDFEPDFYECQLGFADSSQVHPSHLQYQALLDGITAQGVVGISMAVYQPQTGMWTGSSGKADLHNDVALQPCNRLRVGSTVKMVTAVTVLMLLEEGKLGLDDKISDYFQGDVIDKIENADQATIRQLLNHSSGIYNYIQNLTFQTASLNDLIREWQPEDLLQYAYGQSAYFAPGEDVRYSNTGYIMLGMLIEAIEGKPFGDVFEEKIFAPLGMHQTRFAAKDPVPDGIARGYVDFYSNLQVIESTYFSGWDYYTADGGMISNPYEMNLFVQAVTSGALLSPVTMQEMMIWKAPKDLDPAFFPISYGLGIFKIETPWGEAYLHSGDAIGYYANMVHFPADSTTIVYAVNSNYGKIDEFVSTKAAMEKVFGVVLD